MFEFLKRLFSSNKVRRINLPVIFNMNRALPNEILIAEVQVAIVENNVHASGIAQQTIAPLPASQEVKKRFEDFNSQIITNTNQEAVKAPKVIARKAVRFTGTKAKTLKSSTGKQATQKGVNAIARKDSDSTQDEHRSLQDHIDECRKEEERQYDSLETLHSDKIADLGFASRISAAASGNSGNTVLAFMKEKRLQRMYLNPNDDSTQSPLIKQSSQIVIISPLASTVTSSPAASQGMSPLIPAQRA